MEDIGLDVHFSLDDLRQQNVAFEDGNEGVIGKLVYAMMTMNQAHPWRVSRIQAMDQWSASGGFDQLLAKYGAKD